MNKNLIIIADDEKEISEFIKIFLVNAKYDVVIVNNGQELVDSVKNLEPSIIITDLGMPVKDGAKAVAEIKEINKEIISVIMTAIPNKEVKKVADLVGADFFIQKPIKESDIFNLMIDIERKRSSNGTSS